VEGRGVDGDKKALVIPGSGAPAPVACCQPGLRPGRSVIRACRFRSAGDGKPAGAAERNCASAPFAFERRTQSTWGAPRRRYCPYSDTQTGYPAHHYTDADADADAYAHAYAHAYPYIHTDSDSDTDSDANAYAYGDSYSYSNTGRRSQRAVCRNGTLVEKPARPLPLQRCR